MENIRYEVWLQSQDNFATQCQYAMKALFLFFNLCLSVMLDSLIYIHVLSY
jgi:hypothetical protein